MTTAADRHLLFGLLALQNGMINQAQLVHAFQAWTLDKSKGLADHLEARGDLTGARRALLEALVEVHLEAHGGDMEKSLAAVSAGKSTRESLARLGDPDIEATLGHVGCGRGSTDDGDPDRTSSYAVGTATSDGQRFRVLRPHARGGLGAVFVALDGELNREVALKQILDHHADDPISRHRFLLEAEVTGGLEHPGIVPVYGLGSYADGRPYYAMRFIRGDSLKEAIDRFHATKGQPVSPSPLEGEGRGEGAAASAGNRSLQFRKLLRRFTDVCNAIDYAHSRGVLHRDIKPGNIIVGKHGETLVVDWGLAKILQKDENVRMKDEKYHDAAIPYSSLILHPSSLPSETLPGSALGTPAYMSPEQAAGDLEQLGPRSDVYSLGATLYCLLAGKPPQEGNDIGELLRRVQRGEFVMPRQLEPSVDRALEAVCLKAMATKPEDRYGSCRALADDIERWMADEPVIAYREPFSRRARRWAKRNRAVVTAAAAALVAGVIGLSAVLLIQTQAKAAIADALGRETTANEALATANRSLATANDDLAQSRAAVQARYDLAVEAIKTFHTGVSEDFLLKQDQFKELRDRLLKSAADFYGKLSARLGKETDLASRRALLKSNFELASLTSQVGVKEDALAAHRAVLATREALAAESGSGTAAAVDVGLSLTAVAGLLEATGRTDEALATYRRAEVVLTGPAETDAGARSALAACRSNLGWLLHRAGRSAEGLEVLGRARLIQESVSVGAGAPAASRRDRAAARSRSDLADTHDRIGLLLQATGRLKEAETEYRAAEAIYAKLAADHPADTGFRRGLANCRVNLGWLHYQTSRLPEAETEYRAAAAILEKLAADNPAVTHFRSEMAQAHNHIGSLHWLQAKHVEAADEYRQVIKINQRLVDDHSAVAIFRFHLADAIDNLGLALLEMGKFAEAEAEFRRALPIRQKLVADDPAFAVYRERLATLHSHLGMVLMDMGKSAESEAESRRALPIFQKLADDNPTVTLYQTRLSACRAELGWLLSLAGRPTESEAEFRRALAIQRKLVADNPAVTHFRTSLAKSHVHLGDLLSQTGRSRGAEAEYRAALALYQQLAADNPRVPLYRDSAANLDNSLAVLLRRLGRPAEARDHGERAVAAREVLVREGPKATQYRAGLAENYLNRALARRALGDVAGASSDLRRALGLFDALPSRSAVDWFLFACSHAALGPRRSSRLRLVGRRGVELGRSGN